ncbi:MULTISPECIES: SDR family NAD(P)-dependent oxidoreductase [Brevibacillus]|uniref:SDR family NAD(P)-dependent oxidoreductase n=1 Tax=Brevibacillus agri TaxID=51101 RepID=A0A3M8AND0_9BACL|nr:SDR family NAD(P)-dependent oxidoreductase [Brevibacillus agri]MBY0054813.1 SDR family NAD(P)-dependent oxidoreductase [Brevibacillus agri]QAV13255.1 hypothetical protein BA6348_11135 [Brevibacillus agri]RNB52147.1 SDR family NAD(P)-dependent oxidoreductase [Brevibacillus agri]
MFYRENVGTTQIVNEILERFGGVDIWVNNVGASPAPIGGALAQSDADWQLVFETNLFAAVRLDRGLLPSMLKQGHGVIVIGVEHTIDEGVVRTIYILCQKEGVSQK